MALRPKRKAKTARKRSAQKRWIFLWKGGGYNTVHAATAQQAYALAREMGELKPGGARTRKLVPVRSSVQPYTVAADRAQSAGFDGVRGTRGLRGTRQGIAVELVHINRQGYDSRGRYWGVGQKLYRVTTASGDAYLRAASAQAARAKVQSDSAYVKQAQGTRQWGDRFDGVRGVRKSRCLRWSKGRTRCLKRA